MNSCEEIIEKYIEVTKKEIEEIAQKELPFLKREIKEVEAEIKTHTNMLSMYKRELNTFENTLKINEEIPVFDIKPENILFNEKGEPFLVDFGLAKLQLLIADTGGFFGTPLYASPEQFSKEKFGEPDHRTDIYQFGAVLYELLTGKPPFEGDMYELTYKILHEKPVPPHKIKPDIPKELSQIVLKALEKKKESRFKNAEQMKKALEELKFRNNLRSKTANNNRNY